MKLSIYRFDPDKDERPYVKDYEVTPEASDRMLLDVLVKAKVQDDSLSFRRSCAKACAARMRSTSTARTAWLHHQSRPTCRSTSRCARCRGCR